MPRLAGKYADMCYIPPWNKMPHQETRKIVLEQAKHDRRENRIRFVEAYTPLGPDQWCNREEYGRKVEEARKNGFGYFITAFSMEAPPWEAEASSEKAMRSYLKCLKDFATTFIQSHDE